LLRFRTSLSGVPRLFLPDEEEFLDELIGVYLKLDPNDQELMILMSHTKLKLYF